MLKISLSASHCVPHSQVFLKMLPVWYEKNTIKRIFIWEKGNHIQNEETNEKLGKYLQHIKEEKNYCTTVSLKIKNRENKNKIKWRD